MADLRIYNKALTADAISKMARVGDFDGDRKVDANDLSMFTDEWLNNYTSRPLTSTLMQNGDFETYGDLQPLSGKWEEFYYNTQTESTVSLLSVAADAHAGTKAMRWNYNSAATSGDPNWNYTEILYYCDPVLDLSQYDQIRIWVKRHAGNSQEGLLYVKLLEGTMVNQVVAESQLTKAEGSSFGNPDQWYEWKINLHNLRFLNNYTDLSQLTYIESLMVGVSSTSSGTAGTGIIDIDDISLVNLPVCGTYKDEDINRDCIINFVDFAVFAQNWMLDN
jgi:hypothetical protein